MPLVIVSKGTLARSRLRTVTMRMLAVGAGALTLLGLLGGFALGILVGAERAGRSSEFASLDPTQPGGQALINEIGSLSGRLIQLEALAGRLSRSIGARPPAKVGTPNTRAESAGQPAGGPLIAPSFQGGSGTDALLSWIDGGLGEVETSLDFVASMVARRDLDQMAFPSRLPIPGIERTSGFGLRIDPFTHRPARHAGFDYVAAPGTSIFASAGGRVRRAGPYGAFGKTVEIDHGESLVTRYGHLSRILVHVGDVVLPGQAIATVGSTGRSTGPHLHFEILRDGKQVHPDLYLAGDGH